MYRIFIGPGLDYDPWWNFWSFYLAQLDKVVIVFDICCVWTSRRLVTSYAGRMTIRWTLLSRNRNHYLLPSYLYVSTSILWVTSPSQFRPGFPRGSIFLNGKVQTSSLIIPFTSRFGQMDRSQGDFFGGPWSPDDTMSLLLVYSSPFACGEMWLTEAGANVQKERAL